MSDTSAAAVLARIQQRLDAVGLSERGAEQAAGRASAIRNLRTGLVQSVKIGTLEDLAPVLKTSALWLQTGEGAAAVEAPAASTAESIARFRKVQTRLRAKAGLPPLAPDVAAIALRGEVAAGQWLEVDHVDAPSFEEVRLPVDSRFPAEAQFGLLVRGTSINKVAPDGAYLTCIDTIALGYEVREGDLVIVERTRDGGHLRERTAKRYRRNGDTHELWPDSSDPHWTSPIVIDPDHEAEDVSVQIVGLVVWVHNQVLQVPNFPTRI
ncbi:LexA family protein [Methylobacterium frigidaeris]|uniref:Peptidase S24/S26A/S26B/S26C domain-containing protein n=1 Tax=Methylobacterium frigidaeris TaxID=2038277 RepID=A0AA37M6Q7_9HYPH|nr:S24 family peptidase [Methylobacterium frigidaeris]PIK74590.1 hypothetical protein CS379_01700 [Methylobacterium frigidaeris]GJD65153.1 hypothetical protein MPEAHAMD_5340 [Methylobacterium frigidaeris]